MTSATESIHGMWSSRWMFILAATGSAVGIGNIWKFPYMAGANGGSAFVLVYLICIAMIGGPVMMAEVLAGREGRQSPINTLTRLAALSGLSRHWRMLGWLGACTGFLILSYYGVISGWVMSYIFSSASGTLQGADGAMAAELFRSFTADPLQVLFWQGLFMLMTILIVARGVGDGLEMAVKYLMPALFVLLIALIGYAATTGYFMQGLEFLFKFNPSAITSAGVLAAMGQAFFTLSLGMGTMIAYGAYMPREANILSTVGTIAVLDTVVALMAGMAIFPIVYANGLDVGEGPGLMFITLPLAFGNMAGGQLFGTLFFVLVTFAAITSSISLVEPAVAWLVEKFEMSRPKAAMVIGGIAWFVGIGTALSTNLWAKFHIVGDMTFFDSVDYLTSNIMLPLGGLVFALFAGWFLDRTIIREQLALGERSLSVWTFLVRFVAPVIVSIVFVMKLLG